MCDQLPPSRASIMENETKRPRPFLGDAPNADGGRLGGAGSAPLGLPADWVTALTQSIQGTVGALVATQLEALGSKIEEGLVKVDQRMEAAHLDTTVQLGNRKSPPGHL